MRIGFPPVVGDELVAALVVVPGAVKDEGVAFVEPAVFHPFGVHRDAHALSIQLHGSWIDTRRILSRGAHPVRRETIDTVLPHMEFQHRRLVVYTRVRGVHVFTARSEGHAGIGRFALRRDIRSGSVAPYPAEHVLFHPARFSRGGIPRQQRDYDGQLHLVAHASVAPAQNAHIRGRTRAHRSIVRDMLGQKNGIGRQRSAHNMEGRCHDRIRKTDVLQGEVHDIRGRHADMHAAHGKPYLFRQHRGETVEDEKLLALHAKKPPGIPVVAHALDLLRERGGDGEQESNEENGEKAWHASDHGCSRIT